ncbi:phage regulatory CII family protein [Pseudomonas sp. efr-133-R2A-59]
MEQVHRAIHEAVLEAGPKKLAHLMGMSHTALLNRSNPNDDSHRLNLEQFLQILVHCSGLMKPDIRFWIRWGRLLNGNSPVNRISA